jgi:two-component sensor histidine kinase
MSRLKSIRLPVSANIKLVLVFTAFMIVTGTLYYTQQLVEEMKRTERKSANLYANILSRYWSEETASEGFTAVFWDIVNTQTIEFPMIITNGNHEPSPTIDPESGKVSFSEYVKNVELDTLAPAAEQEKMVRAMMEEMKKTYDPLPVYYIVNGDSTVTNYVYYSDSDVIQKMRLLPWVGIVIMAMFIFVGYLSFSHIKRNEQSNIWVGMAKETAHQLGTPLSSLLGWIELLRMMPEDTEQVLEAAEEMQRDVDRLTKVAQRFSKIGSAAQVRTVEVHAILEHIMTYFERRLPHLGKKVTLKLDEGYPVWVAINVDLFEWVFENLIRNAADAIDRPDGEIRLRVREVRNTAVIDVSDNGRGIDQKIRKDIFRPGFSTKSRGWGLGLSLAKRIVEEYHGGKIVVKESSPRGTTFRIRLNAVPAPVQEETPGIEVENLGVRS